MSVSVADIFRVVVVGGGGGGTPYISDALRFFLYS